MTAASSVPTARPAVRPTVVIKRAARSGLYHARLDRATHVAATPVVEEPAEQPDTGDDVLVVWARYKDAPTAAVREQLILHYAPLVAMVASRVGMRLPSSVEHADLVSYGMFGLIDAIEKFEPCRDIKFETYANTRIRGAILDELRAADWVPRSVRSKARAVDRAYAELEAELHRAPAAEEVSERLGITVSELHSVQSQVSSVNLVALDEVVGTGDRVEQVSALDTVQRARSNDPARTFEAKETKFLLSQAMDQLGEREKIMLVLYYYEGMTLAEIGRVLGVTESRVSQMHSAAMLRLRSRLTTSESV